VDEAYILYPPFNDPSGIAYSHFEEVPYEFEVLDAKSCLCGGEELTYNTYYLTFDWDSDPFVFKGSGGQVLSERIWVNYIPCVDIASTSLSWKEFEYDNDWNQIDTGGYVSGVYTVWGISETDTINPALCSSGDDFTEVILALDKVEYNQDSKTLILQSKNDKQEQVNNKLYDLKSKIAVTNNELNSINGLMNLNQLNHINVNKTTDNSIFDDLLNKFTSMFNFTSDMNSQAINEQMTTNSLNTLSSDDFTSDDTSIYTDFTNTFQTKLSNSYNTYLSSLGIGGYSTAPTPIQLDIYGNTYKFLDVSTFEDDVPMLRATFLSFGYLCGLILSLKSM